jgi:glycosyltransferase involved in cell wall biosynthesis
MSGLPPAPLHLFLTEVLGNRIVSEHVRRAVHAFGAGPAAETAFTSADWAREHTRWAALLGPTTEAIRAGARVLARADVAPGATVVATSWELAVAAAEDRRVGSVVMLCDAVPTPGFRRVLPTPGPVSLPRRAVRAWVGARFRRALTRTAGVLALSEVVRREVVALAPHLDETAVVARPPVPDWAAAVVPESYAGGRPLRLLFVGNDFARKGGDRLRGIAERLRATTPAELRAVTNDPAAAALLGDAGTVVRGITHPAHLAEHYAWADVLLLPTRHDMSPNVLLEAGAAAVPSVAADVGTIGEIVAHEERGWLMRADAPDAAWADRLRTLAADPPAVATAGARARAWVMDHCSEARFADAVHACLRAAARMKA